MEEVGSYINKQNKVKARLAIENNNDIYILFLELVSNDIAIKFLIGYINSLYSTLM
jgi:hypothetical protein